MSNYTKSTNFATKDNLTPGDPLKIVRGTEIDTEFNNIATAIATKTDNASSAITGGTINDTTIGATTASTGAFTTLAASGNVTLSGGTANGVAYLNGSKVVTSGTALWFDGTNFGVGTGGNTLNQQSVVYKAGANTVYQQIANGSTGLGATNGIRVGVSSAGVGEWYSPTAAISYIDNTEQMRLTSTGLGIGTSSPSQKLDVAGSVQIQSTGIFYLNNSNNTNQYYWQNIGASGANNATLILSRTNAGETLRVDSSGNVGIGTTSPTSRLVVGSVSDASNFFRINSSTVQTVFGSDASGGYVGTDNSYALRFFTNNTERARIDSSGNLLMGTTSTPTTAEKVIAMGNATAPTASITGGILYVEGGALKFRGSSGTVTTIAPA